MLLPSNVQEEGESILTFISTMIAFERIFAMISHVDGIHGAVLERYSTKFTSCQISQWFCSIDWKQTWHIRDLLLRVSVHVKPPLDLVRLALASVLGVGRCEGGAAGVGPGVASTLIVAGTSMRSSSNDVVATFFAQIQNSTWRLALLCQF